MRLRAYQSEDVSDIIARLEKPGSRGMLVRPTGTGKTTTAAAVLKRTGWRALVVGHRAFLSEQWATELRSAGVFGQVHYAMRQTLLRGGRLQEVRPSGFDVVIFDEAHFGAKGDAAGTRTILEHFPKARRLALTATPYGAPAQLAELFGDRIGDERETLWFQREGHLVPLLGEGDEYIRAWINADEKQLRTLNAIAGEKAAAKAVSELRIEEHVAKVWKKHGKGRTGLIAALTIESANRIAELIGRGAAVLTADSTADEEREVIAGLESGRVRVVVNCTKLIEGFNVPKVDAVVYARPCHSLALAVQFLGRALRPYPGKRDCMLIDCFGVVNRHPILLAPFAGMAGKTEKPLVPTGRKGGPRGEPLRLEGEIRTERASMRAQARADWEQKWASVNAEILKLGLARVPNVKIAEQLNVDRAHVWRVLERNNVVGLTNREAQGMTSEIESQIISLGRTMSAVQLSKKLGCSDTAVRKTMKRHNIKPLTKSEAIRITLGLPPKEEKPAVVKTETEVPVKAVKIKAVNKASPQALGAHSWPPLAREARVRHPSRITHRENA